MKAKHYLKKYIVAVLVALLLVALTLSATTYALNLFSKTVAGLGQMTFTDEVIVEDIKVKSLSKVDVTVVSKMTTQPDHIYQVSLYLDDVKWSSSLDVSWSAGEIPNIKKKLSFTGLSLGAITIIDAEVED